MPICLHSSPITSLFPVSIGTSEIQTDPLPKIPSNEQNGPGRLEQTKCSGVRLA
jgi:hypothetical protein